VHNKRLHRTTNQITSTRPQVGRRDEPSRLFFETVHINLRQLISGHLIVHLFAGLVPEEQNSAMQHQLPSGQKKTIQYRSSTAHGAGRAKG
jgi:hypothetical protein